jgi:regulator of replication initiation timing
MEQLDHLRERVNELLKRHTALLQENEHLYKEQERLQAEITKLRSITQEAQLQRLSQAIGESMPDDSTRVKNRNALDEVIREIDQILASLHA